MKKLNDWRTRLVTRAKAGRGELQATLRSVERRTFKSGGVGSAAVVGRRLSGGRLRPNYGPNAFMSEARGTGARMKRNRAFRLSVVLKAAGKMVRWKTPCRTRARAHVKEKTFQASFAIYRASGDHLK